MFLTRSGYLTEPSPPVVFNSAGNTQWQLSNLPLGPPNVVARVFGFTGAGGENFFTITSSIQFPNPFSPTYTPIVIEATAVNDNTSEACVIDVSDNALFGAQGIDIDGNDLFNQVVLGPCLGMFYYASRLITWGMSNKLENFLSMGFEGGIPSSGEAPILGWTVPGTGGGLVAGENGFGEAWQITGDGSTNRLGEITQPAFQGVPNGVPIIEPSTLYNFTTCYAVASAGATGMLYCDLFSPTKGLIARAIINIATITKAGFYEATFSLPTNAVVPADAILDIYEIGLALGATVTIDELELIPTYDPYLPGVVPGQLRRQL